MSEKLFSVVVVTFQQNETILCCIDSILSQTYPEIELIICDDSSCDFDEKKIRDYIEKYKSTNIKNVIIKSHETNRGIPSNYQDGLQASSGKYLIFISGDDLLRDGDVLNNLVEIFDKKEAKVIAARGQICSREGKDLDIFIPYKHRISDAEAASPHQFLELLGREPLQDAYVCTEALIWERELLLQLGGFDLKYRYIQYWPLLVKVCQANIEITYIDRVIVKCRQGGAFDSNVGLNKFMKELYYKESIKFLEEVYVQIMKGKKLTSQLRCKFVIESLKAAIIRDVYWWTMSTQDRWLWRLKNIQLLLLRNIYGLRTNGLKEFSGDLLFLMIFVAILKRIDLGFSQTMLSVWYICLGGLILLSAIYGINLINSIYVKVRNKGRGKR